jgi:hypothetical protein
MNRQDSRSKGSDAPPRRPIDARPPLHTARQLRKRRLFSFLFCVIIGWLLIVLNSLRSQQQFSVKVDRQEDLSLLPPTEPSSRNRIECVNCSKTDNLSNTSFNISAVARDGYVKDSEDVDEEDAEILKEKQGNRTEKPSAAICTIIRGENRYLEEWTLYHLALGFERIYIYDNSDTSSAERWLRKEQANNTIIQNGVHVHIFKSKNKRRQPKAFRDCTQRFGKNHTWVGYYDPDEFLVLKKHDHVVDLLTHHCGNGSLGINWVIFGTSNQTEYDDAPVTKRFQYHTGVDKHVKTIVKVSDYNGQRSAHWVNLEDPKQRRDTNGEWIKGPRYAGTSSICVRTRNRWLRLRSF